MMMQAMTMFTLLLLLLPLLPPLLRTTPIQPLLLRMACTIALSMPVTTTKLIQMGMTALASFNITTLAVDYLILSSYRWLV